MLHSVFIVVCFSNLNVIHSVYFDDFVWACFTNWNKCKFRSSNVLLMWHHQILFWGAVTQQSQIRIMKYIRGLIFSHQQIIIFKRFHHGWCLHFKSSPGIQEISRIYLSNTIRRWIYVAYQEVSFHLEVWSSWKLNSRPFQAGMFIIYKAESIFWSN